MRTTMPEPRAIATCWDYAGFLAACKARAHEQRTGLNSPSAAEITGLHKDHLAKVMSEKSGRFFTPLTLGPLLGLLGMKIVLVEDPEAMARVTRRLEKRTMTGRSMHLRGDSVHFSITKAQMAEIQKKGGENSRKGMTARNASKLGRKAANVRWGKKTAARTERARHAALMRWSPTYRAAQNASGPPD